MRPSVQKNMKTVADRIIRFNANLNFSGLLPPGIGVMNPFVENSGALEASSFFYRKFYNDNNPLVKGVVFLDFKETKVPRFTVKNQKSFQGRLPLSALKI